jgi:predicted metal-binding protein
MNGRFAHEETPEGRLAAIAVWIAETFADRHAKTGHGPTAPDVADLREIMRPYVQRELLKARIDEFERLGESRNKRRTDLVRELYECEVQIPLEHRL